MMYSFLPKLDKNPEKTFSVLTIRLRLGSRRTGILLGSVGVDGVDTGLSDFLAGEGGVGEAVLDTIFGDGD